MKHNSYIATLLLVAVLVYPSSNLLAQDSEGTLEKIARTGEFVIGSSTSSPARAAIGRYGTGGPSWTWRRWTPTER